jgi:hypothetical protein
MRGVLVVMSIVWTLAGGATVVEASSLKLPPRSTVFKSTEPSQGQIRNAELGRLALVAAPHDNAPQQQVEYRLSGELSPNPSNPSGVSSFALNRTHPVEDIVPSAKPVLEGSLIEFKSDVRDDLFDGLQLNGLVAEETGLILEVDVREFERPDRARYQPLRSQASGNEIASLQTSNRSSGSTSATNPSVVELVEADVGEESTSGSMFKIKETRVVTTESGTGLLLGVGLTLFAYRRRTGA